MFQGAAVSASWKHLMWAISPHDVLARCSGDLGSLDIGRGRGIGREILVLAIVGEGGRQEPRDNEKDREHNIPSVPAEEVERAYENHYDPVQFDKRVRKP